MIPKFRETISFDWDVIEFPSSAENKVYIDSSGWAITKKSKNKDIALDFIKYLSKRQIIGAKVFSNYSFCFKNCLRKRIVLRLITDIE